MIALFLYALAGEIQSDPLAGKRAGVAYLGCVRVKARQLEVSRESAEAIATAALSKCAPQLDGAVREWAAGWEERVIRIGLELDEADRDKMRRESSDELRKAAHDLAVSVVVSKRAGI